MSEPNNVAIVKERPEFCSCGCGLRFNYERKQVPELTISQERAGAEPATTALPATEKTKTHSGRPADD
jgi:hypothetical protein